MSWITVFKQAWRERASLGDASRTRELAAFLPELLEIQHSPPHPLSRRLAWSLMSFIFIAMLWACLGRVNIVASAQGKIVPSTRVKQIQPLEKGVVTALLVGEGEFVHKGQPLVELDATLTRADRQRLSSELHNAQLRLAVNNALLKQINATTSLDLRSLKLGSLVLPENTHTKERHFYGDMLQQQWHHYLSQWQVLHHSVMKAQAEEGATREVISKLSLTLPIAEKRAARLHHLYQIKYASENDYLSVEQDRIQQQHDLAAERQRLKQQQATVAQAQAQLSQHIAQTTSSLLNDISEQERQIAVLEEELVKANDLNAKRILNAPVAGRIQELTANTIGGVVTEAQQLMLVVPDDEHLIVEAILENKDIGFVREGMDAQIKIHTFPFTQYGVIHASVSNVPDDATVDEQLGLIYRIQLTLANHTLLVEGKAVRLQPGMAVTAEIQTGERRIIEFFLAPLLRYREESMRER